MIETELEERIRSDFSIVPMTIDDLPEVYAIEVASYPNPWAYKCFVDEITQNQYANYVVAHVGGKVVGYGGMWLVYGEAHITNIAVSYGYRRKKIGERILVHLLEHCLRSEISTVYLEVRRSNFAAQRLYSRYLFQPDRVREKYYQDNGEDAVVLRIRDMCSKAFNERFRENCWLLREKLMGSPVYTGRN